MVHCAFKYMLSNNFRVCPLISALINNRNQVAKVLTWKVRVFFVLKRKQLSETQKYCMPICYIYPIKTFLKMIFNIYIKLRQPTKRRILHNSLYEELRHSIGCLTELCKYTTIIITNKWMFSIQTNPGIVGLK